MQDLNFKTASLTSYPGLARTNLQHTCLAANQSWQEAFAFKLMDSILQSASKAGLSQLLAATDLNAKSGVQYGPWLNFMGPQKKYQIASTALNRLDRDKLWKASEEIIFNFG